VFFSVIASKLVHLLLSFSAKSNSNIQLVSNDDSYTFLCLSALPSDADEPVLLFVLSDFLNI